MLAILFIASAIYYSLYAPEWLKGFLREFFRIIWSIILDFSLAAYHLLNISIHVLHWVGRFFVVLIFIGASVTLIDNISIVLDIRLLNPEGTVFKLTTLFENKVTWVAATAIMAATVALGHFKTLDFNYQKHEEEQKAKHKN